MLSLVLSYRHQGFWTRPPGFEYQLCYLFTVWLNLDLSFLNWKMAIIRAPTSQNYRNVPQMAHITVPNKCWLNQMNKQNSHVVMATRCYIILKSWCRWPPSLLRNRCTVGVLQYLWFFLWHNIIIILWNKTMGSLWNQERESMSFSGKKDLRWEGLFGVHSQSETLPKSVSLSVKWRWHRSCLRIHWSDLRT